MHVFALLMIHWSLYNQSIGTSYIWLQVGFKQTVQFSKGLVSVVMDRKRICLFVIAMFLASGSDAVSTNKSDINDILNENKVNTKFGVSVLCDRRP